MTNVLFDLFISNKSAKAIWETLEKKYGTDDAGKKKYATGKWLQFKMVDDKPIMNQVHEYENLVADILTEGMKMCDVLQANVLIEKLPDTWSNYRNHLKHKKRDMSLEEQLYSRSVRHFPSMVSPHYATLLAYLHPFLFQLGPH